jgi:hypothetical protein
VPPRSELLAGQACRPAWPLISAHISALLTSPCLLIRLLEAKESEIDSLLDQVFQLKSEIVAAEVQSAVRTVTEDPHCLS